MSLSPSTWEGKAMTAEEKKTSKIPIYQDNTTANPSRGGYKSLDTSAGHTHLVVSGHCCQASLHLPGRCVRAKSDAAPWVVGRLRSLQGRASTTSQSKLAGPLEHRNTRHDRAAAREKRLPLDASRRELLVAVISFQSTAVEAPEERRAQSVAAGPLPPAATVRHGSHAR